jgi:K+ transporter
MFKKTKNVWITILVAIILITIFQTYQSNINIKGDTIEKIAKKEEISLNVFIEKYKNNDFSKLDLINDNKLV